MIKKSFYDVLCLGSIVLEHYTHNSKIEGLNPTIGTRRKKIAKKSLPIVLFLAIHWGTLHS